MPEQLVDHDRNRREGNSTFVNDFPKRADGNSDDRIDADSRAAENLQNQADVRRMGARRIVVVLGMHRSGTSAITRGLEELGVGLGDNLMPENFANPKGYWEDIDIYGLSEELLRVLNQRWDCLDPIPASAWERPEVNRFKLAAIDLLRTKIDQAGLWGFKDPRTVRLLPFWKAVFGALSLEPCYVISVRNPLSVARSLEKRDGFAFEKSCLLWLEHSVNAVLGTSGTQRVVVDYDLLMDDPARELGRMASALALGAPIPEELSHSEYALSFLTPELRHTRYDLSALSVHPALAGVVGDAYELLLGVASEQVGLDEMQGGDAWREVGKEYREIRAFSAYFDNCETQFRSANERSLQNQALCDQALVERDRAFMERDRALTERDRAFTERDRALTERDRALTERDRALTERDGQIVAFQREVEEREGRLARIQNEAAESEQRLSCLQQTLMEEREQLNRAHQALAEQSSRITDLLGDRATLEKIRSSTVWRALVPLRWYGRQRGRAAWLLKRLPSLLTEAGGVSPLVFKTVEAWRREGLDGIKSFVRRRPYEGESNQALAQAATQPNEYAGDASESASLRPGILFVSHDASRTGAPILLLDLIRLLAERLDIDCPIVLCRGGTLEEEFYALGKTWVLSDSNRMEAGVLEGLRRRNIKLIYSNTITNGAVQVQLKELGLPIFCHVHELAFSIERFFGGDNLQQVLQTTTLFLVACGDIGKYLHERYGVPKDRIIPGYPFVAARANQDIAEDVHPSLPLPENAMVIGACGTIGWRKGTDLFLQVARLVLEEARRPVVFVWLGGELSQPEYHGLRHDAALMGIDGKIIFTGTVKRPLDYYALFDIFILPSREDPFPLVMLDAASVGLPIVCFEQAGGAPELVEEDAGIVVPYLDLEQMAKALLLLLDDGDLRRRLGARAREKVFDRHDIDVSGDRFADLIKDYL